MLPWSHIYFPGFFFLDLSLIQKHLFYWFSCCCCFQSWRWKWLSLASQFILESHYNCDRRNLNKITRKYSDQTQFLFLVESCWLNVWCHFQNNSFIGPGLRYSQVHIFKACSFTSFATCIYLWKHTTTKVMNTSIIPKCPLGFFWISPPSTPSTFFAEGIPYSDSKPSPISL